MCSNKHLKKHHIHIYSTFRRHCCIWKHLPPSVLHAHRIHMIYKKKKYYFNNTFRLVFLQWQIYLNESNVGHLILSSVLCMFCFYRSWRIESSLISNLETRVAYSSVFWTVLFWHFLSLGWSLQTLLGFKRHIITLMRSDETATQARWKRAR